MEQRDPESHSASQQSSPPLTELDGSLQCSQESATGSYPYSVTSSAHFHTLFP